MYLGTRPFDSLPSGPHRDEAKSRRGASRSTPLWSDLHVEIITRDWLAGVATPQIALNICATGREGTTKNSVIGKAKRLGLGAHPEWSNFASDKEAAP